MAFLVKGAPEILQSLSLPKTSDRQLDLVITELAIIEPGDQGLILKEISRGAEVAQALALTGQN